VPTNALASTSLSGRKRPVESADTSTPIKLPDLQKSLNGAALNCVYLVVCAIERCPSQSCMDLTALDSG
jgi:hypothetical protein